MNSFLNEYRCGCGKLLLKGVFFDGTAEIKCRNCGKINKIGNIRIEDDDTHYSLVINDKGIIVSVSTSACKILDYKNNEIVGKSFTEINPTLPKEFGRKTLGPESVLDDDNYFQLDTYHKSKGGKIIPITVLLKLYKPNNKEKRLFVLAEIKSKRNDLKTFEENNPSFIKKTCDFYFEIDKNGMGTYVCPSMEKIFGFSPETLIGKDHFDILPPNQRVEAIKDFLYFSSKEQPYRATNSGAEANGKTVNYEAYFTPNFNDSGKFIGYRVLGWLKK